MSYIAQSNLQSTLISENHTRALILALNGFKVFPCREVPGMVGDKERPVKAPYLRVWQREASNDPAKIREWWTKYPNALIGFPTGKRAGVSGIVVVDLDEKDGKSASRSIKALDLPNDPVMSMRTLNNGSHAYYAYPEGVDRIGSSSNMFGDILGHASGIDIRADGGYVIVYDDPYKLIHAALTPLPSQYLVEKETRHKAHKAVSCTALDQPELLSALNKISPDVNRIEWIRIGTALKATLGGGKDAFNIFNDWSAGSRNKYYKPEMKCVWNSLDTGKSSARTIYHFARKNGWKSSESNMMERVRQIAHEKVKVHREFGDLRSILETEIAIQFSFLPDDEVSRIAGYAADFVSHRYVSDEEYRAARSEEGKIGNEVKKSRRRARGEIIESEAKPWVQLGVSRATYYRKKMQPGVVSDVFYNGEMADPERGAEGDREGDAREAKRCLSASSCPYNRRESHASQKSDSSVKHPVKHSKETIAKAFGINVRTVNRWEQTGIPSRQQQIWKREGVLVDRLAEWDTLNSIRHPTSTAYNSRSLLVSL